MLTDGRMDGQTNMKLVIAVRNCHANTSKNNCINKETTSRDSFTTNRHLALFPSNFPSGRESLFLASNPCLGPRPGLSLTSDLYSYSWQRRLVCPVRRTCNNYTLPLMHSFTPLQHTVYVEGHCECSLYSRLWLILFA